MGKALIYKKILLTSSLGKCMEISLENLYLTALCIIHGHEVKRSGESCETDYLNYFHLSSSGKNISIMVTKKNKSFYCSTN